MAAAIAISFSSAFAQTDVTPSEIAPGDMPTTEPAAAPVQNSFDLSPVTGPRSRAGERAARAEPTQPSLKMWAGMNLAGVYTSNAGGGTSNNADEYVQGSINLGLHYEGPRLSADAAYTGTGDYYGRYHNLDRFDQNLNLVADAEVVPDTLLLHARGFAQPLSLTRVGTLSAGGGSVSGQNSRDTYGYTVAPEFRLRLSDIATSTTTATQGSVFFVQPSTGYAGSNPGTDLPQDTYSFDVSERIASGDYFSRLEWAMVGTYNYVSQKTQSERQYGGALNVTVGVTRWLSLVGTGGYSVFKSTVPLTRDLNGPIGMGGVQLSSGETFSLTIEGGEQHNFTSFEGSLQWAMTPLTALSAFASDNVTTPQATILSNLTTLASSKGGFSSGWADFGGAGSTNLQAPQGMVSPIPSYGLQIDNSIYRDRSAGVTLSHQSGRTTFTLSGFANIRDRLTVAATTPTLRTSVFGGTFGASRKLWPDLTGNANVSYSFANEFGGHDRILSAQGGLYYSMSENLDLYGSAEYLRRDGKALIGVPNPGSSEFIGMIGIRAHI